MVFKLLAGVAGVMLAFGVASSPALACKGSEVLFSDDFKAAELDSAWEVVFGEWTPNAGKLEAKSDPGKLGLMEYQGDFFPSADVCVDVVAPNIKDMAAIVSGIAFSTAKGPHYIVMRPDGSVGVLRYFKGWLKPVAIQKFDGVKTNIGAVNTIRAVWKAGDPTVQVFINDKPFKSFKAAESNENRKIGLYVEGEGNAFQFSNLKITAPPK
jgi:hypothetical protein